MAGLSLTSASLTTAAVATWPVPAAAPASTAYEVQINGQPTGVYADQNNAFAMFAFGAKREPVEIRIICREMPTVVRVQPASARVAHTQAGNVISFTLTQPRKLVIQTETDRFLYLFADPPEPPPPAPATPGLRVFPPGYHDLAGKDIVLTSNQTLYVAGGAYLANVRHLMIQNAAHVRVFGRGIVAGPTRVFGSRHVLIEGITIHPPKRGWMNKIDVAENVTYRNFKALAGDDSVVNFDGFDVMSGCRDILFEDVFVRGTDDLLTLKHHPQSPGHWSSKAPTAGVTLRQAVLWNLRGGTVIRIGPETIGTSIERVTVEDVDVLDAADGFEILPEDGAHIRDVVLQNIRVEKCRGKLIDFATRNWYKVGTERGRVTGVYLRAWDVAGPAAKPVVAEEFNGVFVDRVRIAGKEPAAAWWGSRVTREPSARPAPDRTPPAVAHVQPVITGPSNEVTRIYVVFTEPVDRRTAEDPGHYLIQPAGRVEAAVLDPYFQQVILQTAPLDARQQLSLQVRGVMDWLGNALTNPRRVAFQPATNLGAAASFASVQGQFGWWYEQFNPAPVQTYNNRRDLMAGPRYWLMNAYPHTTNRLWFGHHSDTTIGPTTMRSGALYWAVRTWRAPADGVVRIAGEVRAEAASAGEQVRIVTNSHAAAPREKDAPLWESALTTTALRHDLQKTVRAGDVVRFILVGQPGRATALVTWDPSVTYVGPHR